MPNMTAPAIPLVIVREGDAYGPAIAAGHSNGCAAELAREHEAHGGGRATVTRDTSRAAMCDWCYRSAYPARVG